MMKLDRYNRWFWYSRYDHEPPYDGWPEYELILLGIVFQLSWTDNTNNRVFEVFPYGRPWTLSLEWPRRQR